jgi:hypothetical protein
MAIFLNKGKNFIINGAMDFWQRNTSFNSILNNTYGTDRFIYEKNGTMVHTLSRSTDVPIFSKSNFNFSYSARLNLTSFQNILSETQFTMFTQLIEGSIFYPLYSKPMVFSFWAKASLVGKYPFAMRNKDADRSYVSTFEIFQPNVWEKKIIKISPITSGIWSINSEIGARTSIVLASGTTYLAPTLDTWLNGNFISHASCVNGVQSGATDFFITGVQIEEGISASNFERSGGSLSHELQLCQRYYEKSYDINTALGTSNNLGALGIVTPLSTANSGFLKIPLFFTTTKRVAPSVNFYSSSGTLGSITVVNTNRTATPVEISQRGVHAIQNTSGVTWNDQSPLVIHWTADAEL